MKNILVTIVLAALGFTLQAAAPASAKDNLMETIKSQISYPESARKAHEVGFVAVGFTIDDQGRVVIKQVNSNNPVLKDYVVQTMQQIVVDCNDLGQCEYAIHIDFELL